MTYHGDRPMTFGAFVVICVVFLLILLIHRKGPSKRKALEAVFFGIAGRLQGTVIRATWPQPPRIQFSAEGRSAILEYSSHETYEGVTRVTVDLKSASPGMLLIFEDSVRSTLPKLFGAQDIRVGDPQFDHKYVIQANPESVATKIFRPDRRADVIASVMHLESLPHATVHLTRDSLTVRARGYLYREAELWALARTALNFTRFVLDLAPLTGVSWVEVSNQGGECQICGSPFHLDHGVIRCSRCRTPHHLECWKYNGRCSTFACGETRYIVK